MTLEETMVRVATMTTCRPSRTSNLDFEIKESIFFLFFFCTLSSLFARFFLEPERLVQVVFIKNRDGIDNG